LLVEDAKCVVEVAVLYPASPRLLLSGEAAFMSLAAGKLLIGCYCQKNERSGGIARHLEERHNDEAHRSVSYNGQSQRGANGG